MWLCRSTPHREASTTRPCTRRAATSTSPTANDAVDVIDPASQRHLYSIPQLRGVAGVLVSDEAQLIVSSNRGENTIGIFPPRRDPQVSKTRGPQSAQGNGSCRITQKEAEHEMGDT